MDSQVLQEVTLLINIDTVHGTETNKILAVCAGFLDCEKYMESVVECLDNVMNNDKFDLLTEFSHVLMSLVTLNKRASYYKKVSIERMKYVLYCVFYHYLLHHQTDLLNSLSDDGKNLRLLYSNAWDLLYCDPEKVKILKETTIAWVNRSCGWSCCDSDSIYIK